MMTMKKLPVLALLLAGLAAPAWADSLITGVVTSSATKQPVEDASVTLLNLTSAPLVTVRTDKQGVYRLEHPPTGTFNLRVEAKGFIPFTRSELSVRSNKTTQYHVSLEAE